MWGHGRDIDFCSCLRDPSLSLPTVKQMPRSFLFSFSIDGWLVFLSLVSRRTLYNKFGCVQVDFETPLEHSYKSYTQKSKA